MPGESSPQVPTCMGRGAGWQGGSASGNSRGSKCRAGGCWRCLELIQGFGDDGESSQQSWAQRKVSPAAPGAAAPGFGEAGRARQLPRETALPLGKGVRPHTGVLEAGARLLLQQAGTATARSGATGFAPPRRAPFPSLFLTQQQLSAPTHSQIREQETSGSSPLILIPPAQGLWGRQGSPHPLGYRPHRSGTPSRAPRPPGASSASWLSSASCSRTSAPAR